METPEINENCSYVQNDSHRCEIKLEEFQFDILCCYEVIKESLPGGGGGGVGVESGEIGLRSTQDFLKLSFHMFPNNGISKVVKNI